MSYNDYYNKTSQEGELPFFEDYHAKPSNPYGNAQMPNQAQANPSGNLYPEEQSGQIFGNIFGKKEPKNYQNLMVYEPRSEMDSKTIIDFLKRKEPAIINLEKANPAVSQRILDFVSGAVYALSGTVHRVAGNIFLLSPNGVEVTVPYEVDYD